MTGLDLALAGLPGVSLTELDSAAALQHRTDRKYVVPMDLLDDLENLVPVGTRILEIEGRRRHGYLSTYLDDAGLDTYLRAARVRRRRCKVRWREYDSGERWLEVKLRGGRGSTRKLRRPVTAYDGSALRPEDTQFVRECLIEAQMDPQLANALRPTLEIAYGRSAVLLPGAAGRVTIDTGLRWRSLARTHDFSWVGAGPAAVIETKTASGAATVMDQRLWRRGHRPIRISKYAVGMGLTHPGLPTNRWHPVLTHHLRPVALSEGIHS